MFNNIDIKGIVAFAVGGVLASNIITMTAVAVLPASAIIYTGIQVASVVGFLVGGYVAQDTFKKYQMGWRPQMPKFLQKKAPEQANQRYGERFKAKPKAAAEPSLFQDMKSKFNALISPSKKPDNTFKKKKDNNFKL